MSPPLQQCTQPNVSSFFSKQDDLQIPSTLRPKLAGMEPAVKAAMLKSSHVLAPATTASAPAPTRGLRRVQSGSSINIESPKGAAAAVLDHRHHHYTAKGATPPDAQGGPSGATATTTTTSANHSRGVSVDVASPQRPKSRSGFTTAVAVPGKVYSPLQIVSLLTGKSSLELEVDVVKKLRLLLRNEAAR
jgi:hypothetical protein